MSLVDVIIVTYGSADLISGCLGSLTGSNQVSRTVVVDNGAGDGSAEAARRAGADVVVEHGRNLGFARAVNRGLRELERCADRTGFVLLLNPDARLGSDTLGVLTSAFASDPSVAIAGPLLRDADGGLTAGAGRAASLPTRIGQCLPLLGRTRCLRPEIGRAHV